MNEIKCFPKNDVEALALLYVKKQDLSEKSPVEVYNMYLNAFFEILEDKTTKIENGYFNK